eukprot:scaffold4731_cov144-Isochrysis_galbana.AAC.4
MRFCSAADVTQRVATRGREAAAGGFRPARCFFVISPEEVPYIACLRGLLPRPSGHPATAVGCVRHRRRTSDSD